MQKAAMKMSISSWNDYDVIVNDGLFNIGNDSGVSSLEVKRNNV
jgi:hypothetical protein